MLQIEFTHTHIFVYMETVCMYILFFSDRREMGLGLLDKIITYFECMRACMRVWLTVCVLLLSKGRRGYEMKFVLMLFLGGGGGEGYGVAWNGIIPVVVYYLIWPAIVLMCWFWTFLHLQLNVRATDRPVLGLTDDSIVNFNINISPIYPVFINAPYNAGTFDETAAVGTVLYNQVSARDADLQVTTSKTVIWVTHFSLLKEQCNDLLLTVIQLLSITAFITKMPFYSPLLLSSWGCHYSDASGLRNCGNSAKYIYQPHKYKAAVPVRLQKMRMGHIFQQPVQPFLFFFLFQYYAYSQVLSVWLFMIGQLLKAQPIVAIVSEKVAIFHRGLNGHGEQTKRSGLCFSLWKSHFLKQQKMIAAEE